MMHCKKDSLREVPVLLPGCMVSCPLGMLSKLFCDLAMPSSQMLYEILESSGSPAKQSLIGEYGGQVASQVIMLCHEYSCLKVCVPYYAIY